jgi:hypothetical protein
MAVDKSTNEHLEYYEGLAYEEEIYLEEGVERFRQHEIFVAESVRRAPSIAEETEHAAEELITGDSDDAPLSEETVADLLRTTKPRSNQSS